MRINNRAHFGWFVFVCIATLFGLWLYLGNFHADRLPGAIRLPPALRQIPTEHHTVGGTPLGLIFGSISLGIFIFAALLGVRKKIVLLRIGTVQRWLRAHIWLTLLTVPLILFHCGFRLGGPMTTTLMALYAVVMLSGFFGLVLQHHMPRLMKERLPAETVFEQIPHIRAQLRAAAEKMSDSFKEAAQKTDAGAPASSAAKAVTSGSTPMASTAGDLSTPTARAKSTVGSTIAAETIATPAATSAESSEKRAAAAIASGATTPATVQPAPPETMGTPTARVPEGAPVPAGDQRASAVAAPPPAVVSVEKVVMPPAPAAPPAKPKAAPVASDPESEAALHALLSQQIIPYLAANRGDRLRLGKPGYSDELFRFVKLRVAEGYRVRVEEIQAWCDERRMLDLQTRLHHWLHGWLFIHVPISFLLLMMTAWHAFVTLFYY